MSGDGVLARRGDLVLLSSLVENGLLDALLELLAEIADAGGDGRRFAGVVEEALKSDGTWDAGRGDQQSPAVVAFGPDGAGLAVTVSGAAWAELTTAHGTRRLVAGQPSMLLRCTTGSPVIAVHGGLGTVGGDIARTDRFSRLDRGTARAGGLSYYPDHPAISGAQPSAEAMPVDAGAAGSGVPEKEAHELSAPEKEAPELGPPEAAAAESGGPDAASVEAEAAAGRPFDAVLLIGEKLGDVEARPPLPLADVQADGPTDDAPAPIILGVYCKNGHFDDPEARYCAVCGISMNQRTLVPRLGPRPPLGLLVLDDGALLQLDADYVIGREPTLDASVAAGKARPLRITDKGGTVSRVHAQIQLDEWRVLVTDLDSANGTRIRGPNEAADQPLIPRVPALLQPGSHVDLGGRGFRYESHRGR
jgi:hypothetical protein